MIKNVGFGAAESIVETRGEEGFTSIDDFCRKLNTHNVNKRALESLIKAGALDRIAAKPDARGSLLLSLERIMSIAQSSQKLRETGQATMFDLFGAEVATPLAGIDLESAPVPKQEMLAWEKELTGRLALGASVHSTPRRILARHVTALCSEITPEMLEDAPPQGREVVIAGIVGIQRRLATRDGRPFIAVEVEDLSGVLEVTVWPDVYERAPDLWKPGNIVLAQLRVRERGERLTAGVIEAVPYAEDFTPPAWASESRPELMSRVADLAAENAYRSNGNGHARASQPAAVPAAPTASGDDLVRAAVLESAAPADAEPPTDEDGQLLDIPIGEDAVIESRTPEEDRPVAENADYSVPAEARGNAHVDPAEAAIPPGDGYATQREEPAKAATPRPEPLRLYLEESGDDGHDQDRLAQAFDLLRASPGTDPVLLTILTREGDEVDLALPAASLDAALIGRLKAVLENSPARAGG